LGEYLKDLHAVYAANFVTQPFCQHYFGRHARLLTCDVRALTARAKMPLAEDVGSYASATLSSSGLIYGLESHCRALCSVEGDADRVRFLIGTQGVKTAESNFVHEITVEDDEAAVVGDDESSSRACIASKVVYRHTKGEIWDLTASPTGRYDFCTFK